MVQRKIIPMNKTASSEVSYAHALGQASVDKRVEILRLIGASGSISQAAREAGVSYKAAWQAVDTLTNLAGVVLVERAVGGAGGGGALLSKAGLQLLAAADALALARSQVLDRLRLDAGGLSSFSQLPIRTSMRNQLPCQVQGLEVMGHIVRVTLALSMGARGDAATASTADALVGALADGSAGARLVSRITRESAELLALQPGLPVLALCKATAVTVQRLTPAFDRDGATGNVCRRAFGRGTGATRCPRIRRPCSSTDSSASRWCRRRVRDRCRGSPRHRGSRRRQVSRLSRSLPRNAGAGSGSVGLGSASDRRAGP